MKFARKSCVIQIPPRQACAQERCHIDLHPGNVAYIVQIIQNRNLPDLYAPKYLDNEMEDLSDLSVPKYLDE